MRCLLLLVLGVIVTQAAVVPVEEDDIEDGEDVDLENVDLAEILQGLFNARDSRDVDDEVEGSAQALDVTEAIEDTPDETTVETSVDEVSEEPEISEQEIARFNNYMDAIYRRMNAALRAKLMDPMTLNLSHKAKKDQEKDKNSAPNNRVEREAVEEETEVESIDDDDDYGDDEEEEEEVSSVNRIGLQQKKRKRGKHGKHKQARKKFLANKKKNPKNSKMNKEKRKLKGKKGQKKSKNKNKNPKNEDIDREKRSKKKQHEGKHKHEHKGKNKKAEKAKNNKKGRSGKDEGPAMGSLTGMATLRRQGDVQIKNAANHKIVKSLFSVGPLELEVSKKYGSGKPRTVRTAMAKTDVMTGIMQLKVKEDGSAHIISVVFKRPEDVDVSGSISDNRKRSDNFLNNSFNKVRPLAAQKILKTARFVLKAPHTKKSE